MRKKLFGIVGLSFLALILFMGGRFPVAQAVPPGDFRGNVPKPPSETMENDFGQGVKRLSITNHSVKIDGPTFNPSWEGACR